MRILHPVSLLLAVILSSWNLVHARDFPTAVALTLGGDGASPQTLSIAGRELTLSGNGGFRIYDATRQAEVTLSRGELSGSGKDMSFETRSDEADVRLEATFEQKDDYILVRGEIENLRGDERGFIVDYQIPRLASGATFSYHLENSVAMNQAEETENNAIPVAAMCSDTAGVAIAIPPDEPRVFGMVGDKSGMSIRLYLGTSPKPKRFPNHASFVFIIYGVEPGWGFRSALSQYHDFFPDYYQQRIKKEGLMMFQMTDRNPPNVEQYGFHLSETQWGRAVLAAALARDEKYNITTFPYSIVGQREIKFLDELPQTYDEAMKAYENWSVADQADHNHTKENAASQGDIYLKKEVESSAVKISDGRYCIQLRDTPWGGNSVTFKINPNPDLFMDQDGINVGRLALDLADKWIAKHPEYDGLFVDSLGQNWPAVLNYRPDHFVYARYPLTFDPEGRVAIQNVISHYAYIETLRKKMYSTGRLTLGNGVYAYNSRKGRPGGAGGVGVQVVDEETNEFLNRNAAEPEHYRAGTKVGRFFCGALLDVASSEAGIRATVERCEDVRVIMGPKPYAFLNYHWHDADKVETLINKSLAFGIFATSNTNWFTGEQYERAEHGYFRDKEMIDWFVPLVRMLSAARWEPVRYATISGEGSEDISCERFGDGDVVYLTLYNDADETRNCELTIDLDGLGFGGHGVSFREIARDSNFYSTPDGAFRISLESKKAYIVELTKGPGILTTD